MVDFQANRVQYPGENRISIFIRDRVKLNEIFTSIRVSDALLYTIHIAKINDHSVNNDQTNKPIFSKFGFSDEFEKYLEEEQLIVGETFFFMVLINSHDFLNFDENQEVNGVFYFNSVEQATNFKLRWG